MATAWDGSLRRRWRLRSDQSGRPQHRRASPFRRAGAFGYLSQRLQMRDCGLFGRPRSHDPLLAIWLDGFNPIGATEWNDPVGFLEVDMQRAPPGRNAYSGLDRGSHAASALTNRRGTITARSRGSSSPRYQGGREGYEPGQSVDRRADRGENGEQMRSTSSAIGGRAARQDGGRTVEETVGMAVVGSSAIAIRRLLVGGGAITACSTGSRLSWCLDRSGGGRRTVGMTGGVTVAASVRPMAATRFARRCGGRTTTETVC
jgi:hypothetical protein